ncbi:MAG: B12-binding domain-containing radical SAM protein [Thermodesulfobacteriota bacterium]
MAEILLIDTNTTPFNEAFPVYPIGLDYLQGALAAAGLGQARVLDLARLGGRRDGLDLAERRARSLELLGSALAARHWDVVGLSLRNLDSTYPVGEGEAGLHHYLPELKQYCDCVAAHAGRDTQVVLGGTGFSIMPQAFLAGRPLNWRGVVGPGETAMVELVAELAAGRTPPRLARGRAGAMGGLQNRALLAAYLDLPQGEGSFGLRTKTGCGQACGYCPYPVVNGPGQALKPPEAVVDEVRLLAEVHAAHPARPPLRFMFADDIFNRPLSHAKAVLRALLAADLRPASWHAYLDPASLDEEFFDLACQSRGWRAAAGQPLMFFPMDIESGSERMLKALGKPYRQEELLAAADAYRRVSRRWVASGELTGAALGFHLLLGYPGEDERSVRESCELINQARPEQIAVQMGVRVYPGTPLARRVRGELWQDEADLERPVFARIDPERVLGWLRAHLDPAYDRLARRGQMLMIGRSGA